MPIQAVTIPPILKFGRNPDVDAGTEDIWSGGGVWVKPTAARVHALVSSSANDDGSPAGTGAQTVVVIGLDASYNLQQETVVMNGTTPVNTAGSYVMIHRMYVDAVGSDGTVAGTITATAATDNTVTAQITPGFNQTLMAIYQVPAGYTGRITRWYAGVGGSVSAATMNFVLYVKEFGKCFRAQSVIDLITAGSNFITFPYMTAPLLIGEKSLVKIQCTSGAANLTANAGFDIELIPILV